MSDPELSPEETATLIDYARRKFGEERWPLSQELRGVRLVIEKLRRKPAVPPMATKQHVPSLYSQKQKRRR